MGTRVYNLKPGDKFFHFTVEEVKTLRIERKGGRASTRVRYVCRCECGNLVTMEAYKLVPGWKKSCGCFRERDIVASSAGKRVTHGEARNGDRPPEYMTWVRMRRRCDNPLCQDYDNYGGRGIKVCKRWRKYGNFLSDMGRRPGKGYSLGRVDNDGDYCRSNCRWETIKQQNGNKRDTRFLIIDGVRKGLSEWSEESGIHPETIRSRLTRGWSDKDAVFGELKQIVVKTGRMWEKRKQ